MAYLDDTGFAYFWGKIKAYIASLLALKADDANVVHKAGEETISGVKTVAGQFQRKSSVVGTLFRNPEAVRGTTPSNNKEWIIPFCDASGDEWNSNGTHGRLGSISVMQLSDGQAATIRTSLVSYANIAGSTLSAGLDVGFAGENGDVPYAQAPSTRADRASGNDIVTRDWLDNDASNLVHRSGVEEIHDVKLFDAADLRLRNTEVVKGSNPSSGTVKNWTYFLADSQGGMASGISNNGRMGALGGTLFDDGTMATAIVAYKNAAGSYDSQSIGVVYAQDGSYWGYAPSTSASRSTGTDIVTRDWIPKDTRIVHIAGDETITGAKTLTSSQGLSMLRVLDRNQTLSSAAVLYGMQLNGKNSFAAHNLLLLAFERNPASTVSSLSEYVNRSFLRVAGATGKVADLSVNMTDTNHAMVSVSVSKDVAFDGYIGNNRVFVAEGNVADSSIAIMQDGVHQYRCGTLRFGNYSDHNTVVVGACNKANSAPRGLTIECNTSNLCTAFFIANVLPTSNNTYSLGNSSLRWSQLYVSASAVSTSDERVKSFISEVPDEVLDAWESVGFIRFKFNDSIAEKGADRARYHSGLIAQRIAEAFSSRGLDASAYGLFCYDEWDAEPEVLDQNGELVRHGHDAGNLYSVRYEEALCMEAAFQRRENARLKKRIADLEERLAALELKVS